MSKTIDYVNKTKQCRKCGIVKPFDEFYKSGTAIHSWCKECENKYHKDKVKKEVLQEINEEKINDFYAVLILSKENEKLKQKIDKAIEYINNIMFETKREEKIQDDLLQILGNKENE